MFLNEVWTSSINSQLKRLRRKREPSGGRSSLEALGRRLGQGGARLTRLLCAGVWSGGSEDKRSSRTRTGTRSSSVGESSLQGRARPVLRRLASMPGQAETRARRSRPVLKQLALISLSALVLANLLNGRALGAPVVWSGGPVDETGLVNVELSGEPLTDTDWTQEPAAEAGLWLERRRLERDRALEPAPWMREQPMRRDSASPLERQSRQLAEDYQVLVQHLVEGALADPVLVSRLYDELAERAQGGPVSQSSSEPDGSLEPLGSGSGAQVASVAALEPADSAEGALLVVANDEVVTADGAGGSVNQPLEVAELGAPYARLRLDSADQQELAGDQLTDVAAPVPAERVEPPFHQLEDVDLDVASSSTDTVTKRAWLEADQDEEPASDEWRLEPNNDSVRLLMVQNQWDSLANLVRISQKLASEARPVSGGRRQQQRPLQPPPDAIDKSAADEDKALLELQAPVTPIGQLLPLIAYLGQVAGRSQPRLVRLQLPVRVAEPNQAALVADHSASSGWWAANQATLVQLALVLVAAAAAIFTVKLLLNSEWARSSRHQQLWRRRLDRGSFRSLWSSSGAQDGQSSAGDTCSSSALVVGGASKAHDLGATAQSLESEQGARRKQVDLLVSKLVNLLTKSSSTETEASGAKEATSGSPAPAETVDEAVKRADSTTSYRSSSSYIKSLIEVLSKARTQFNNAGDLFAVGTCRTGDEFDPLVAHDAPDLSEAARPLAANKQAARDKDDHDHDDDSEVIMSQMDISAAHLILDYMEKHLDDKERLRREWTELNAATSTGSPRPPAKLNQTLLNRLAKSPLAEPGQAVVPFEWNRVKLGTGSWPLDVAGNGRGAGSAAKAGQADYINASFIYDDDPRRPTHIIAQGPSEHTAGLFWQMVWEQGVSIIVMLTRLNENGKRMCHCYWPTNEAASQLPAGADSDDEPANGNLRPAGSSSGSGNLSGARRSSVTSVFNKLGTRHNSNGQPIIASNGDSANNVLEFEYAHAPPDSKPAAASASGARPQRLQVHLVSEHVSSDDYLVRNMYLINQSTGETRTVSQFHYLAWPEQGVPKNPKSLLQFRRKLHKSYRSLSSPILVHCSDGAARSGTYTLIDIILERIKNGAKEIDPRATLEHLRDQRNGLCGSQSQFEFVLIALAEEIQIILNALPQ